MNDQKILKEQPEYFNVQNPFAYIVTKSEDIYRQIIDCVRIAKISRGSEFNPCEKLDDKEFRHGIDFILKLQDRPIPHKSLLEFITFTAKITCSRIATHEIVRHRLCSYMQSSTRYIYAAKSNVVRLIDPELKHPGRGVNYYNPIRRPDITDYPVWLPYAAESIKGYISYLNKGNKIEQARYLLPHNICAQLIMKTNFAEWLHIFKVRTDSEAAPEMQLIFNTIKNDFTEEVLDIFTSLTPEDMDRFWRILLRTDRDKNV